MTPQGIEMKKTELYLLFFIGMIFIPILLLFIEDFFEYFFIASITCLLIYSTIMALYLKFKNNYITKKIILGIIIGNLANSFIISAFSIIIFLPLAMAHYDGPTTNILTHISFILWFFIPMSIVVTSWFFIFIKPFVSRII